jgi:RNA polymerase sigma-70 factor (ECF subfamily)
MADLDTGLSERLRDGDPGALSELATLYGGRLLRAAWFLCRDNVEAQDLVQETFAEAIKSALRFGGRSAPYTWLYGILRRRFLLQCRKRGRFGRWLRLLERPEKAARPAAPTESSGSGDENFGPLMAAIGKLPAKHREVLLLRYIEGQKISAIASLLSISEGTVKSRLHYALRRMKISLRPEAGTTVAPAAEKAHEM